VVVQKKEEDAAEEKKIDEKAALSKVVRASKRNSERFHRDGGNEEITRDSEEKLRSLCLERSGHQRRALPACARASQEGVSPGFFSDFRVYWFVLSGRNLPSPVGEGNHFLLPDLYVADKKGGQFLAV